MSNTELDTKPEVAGGHRDKRALAKYLADYIETERDRADDEIDMPGWIEEGIEAFESIHDVTVCVFGERWRY